MNKSFFKISLIIMMLFLSMEAPKVNAFYNPFPYSSEIIDKLNNFINKNPRNLIGSNCVLISRGNVPPYYDCIGCIVEQAFGCIDDMRNNKSGNVLTDCRIKSVRQINPGSCCPHFGSPVPNGRINLLYEGSNYLEALTCISNAGCKSSIMYQQLLDECHRTCAGVKDPRKKEDDICFAKYNTANTINFKIMITISITLSLAFFLI